MNNLYTIGLFVLTLASCKETAPPSRVGTWAAAGDPNATFVITQDSIFYPDQNLTYKYTVAGDSLFIKYADFDGGYLFKMRGTDTLVLTGDQEQVYYRFAK